MTYLTIQQRIADNLGMLSSSDGVTITSGNRVTQTQIQNKINDIYREELFPLLSDKFPDDFKQGTYPLSTYTGTATASASSTSTTLISSTSVFANSMEGFTVQNVTDGTTAKIVTYTSATQVTLDTTIADTWDGDTFYILGNEYTFGGDTTDIKEVKAVYMKYASTDTYFTKCKRIDYEQAVEMGNEVFKKAKPYFYLTNLTIASVPTQAIGILPFPTAYDGKLKLMYIQRPPALSASGDSPAISVPGISEVIINGVTAWGKMQQTRMDEGGIYQGLYEKGKLDLIKNYKPKTRSNPRALRVSSYTETLTDRTY